ncbi:MAG: Vms1/Ankzf1 family peptidyl-tRNA hydrolase [Dehalococcoidia bacterium]
MNDLIHKLAEVDAGALPFLSIYLDVRPEATGQKPQLREGLLVLEDRLREIRRTFLPRGEDLDSFDADAASINRFVEEEMQASTEGVAIFACNGLGVWEAVEVGTPFEIQVTVASRADLYQLAKLEDEFERAVVGVIDTNTARLYAYEYGALVEAGGPDDDPVHYRKRATGGWSQARYQRHIDKHRKDFTEEIVQAIDDLVAREDAHHVVLAGDEVVMSHLNRAMPKRLAEKVTGVFQADIRANVNEIAAEVAPIMEQAERESGMSAVERLVGEVRRGGLGIAGVAATGRALENGQVDTLVIDEQTLGPTERKEMVRLAATTAAEVEVVQDAAPLAEMEGVGALLRYRL